MSALDQRCALAPTSPVSFLLCCCPRPGTSLAHGDVQLVIPEEVIPLRVFSMTVPQGSTALCCGDIVCVTKCESL